MRSFNAYVGALPRISAERSLQMATAVAAAWGGKAAKSLYDGWRDDITGRQRGTRLDGLGTLSAWKAMNDRARARGELWEQKQGIAPSPERPAWMGAGA